MRSRRAKIEQEENDFLDFIIGATVFGGLLFGIFIVATIYKELIS